jgi:hypothetical protein
LFACDFQLTKSASCQVLSKDGQAIGPKNVGVKIVFRFCEGQRIYTRQPQKSMIAENRMPLT